MNRFWRKPTLAAAAALILLQPACSSDSEETAESYIQTVTNECTLSGGTVTTTGENNCDYQAVVTATAGQTVASSDTTSQTAIAPTRTSG